VKRNMPKKKENQKAQNGQTLKQVLRNWEKKNFGGAQGDFPFRREDKTKLKNKGKDPGMGKWSVWAEWEKKNGRKEVTTAIRGKDQLKGRVDPKGGSGSRKKKKATHTAPKKGEGPPKIRTRKKSGGKKTDKKTSLTQAEERTARRNCRKKDRN